MPDPSIKICGLNSAGALQAAIDARADHAGFNFFPPSPRFISLTDAARLGQQAEGRISRVGVFVDAGDSAYAEAVVAGRLDVLQLHGEETPQRAAELKARYALPVWKVITVAAAPDILRASAYAGAADLILFDARTPKGAALPGGMGLSFDWSLIAGWKGPMPWGLAGGLTPDNVAEAVQLTGARLVDTSSGVESAPGVKDAGKIAAFCRAARGT